MFVIRDTKTGAILFMGRVLDPVEALTPAGPGGDLLRARQPRLPGRLGASGRDVVAVADQRQPDQPRVGEEPGGDPGRVRREVGEATLPVRPALGVEERRGAEAVREPPELAGRDRLLVEVDVVDDDPPLAEEPERGAGGVVVVEPEHLDVGHLLRRRLAERRRHRAAA